MIVERIFSMMLGKASPRTAEWMQSHREDALNTLSVAMGRGPYCVTIPCPSYAGTARGEPAKIGDLEYIRGAETEIMYPTETEGMTGLGILSAVYALVPQAKVLSSHDPLSFSETSGYPRELQERDYFRDQLEQQKVQRQTQTFLPELVINTNPDAVNGPPVIDRHGWCLGGNSRVMTIKRVLYESDPNSYTTFLEQELQRCGGSYGLAGSDVRGQILVRLVTGDYDPASISRDLNRSMTQSLDLSAQAVSLGKLLPVELFEVVGHAMLEEDATITTALGKNSARVLELLQKAKIITPQTYGDFTVKRAGVTTQELSTNGRAIIRMAIVGSLVDDKELLTFATALQERFFGYIAPYAMVLDTADPTNAKGYNWIPSFRRMLTWYIYHPTTKVWDLEKEFHAGELAFEADDRHAVAYSNMYSDPLAAILLKWAIQAQMKPKAAADSVREYLQGTPGRAQLGLFGEAETPEELRIRTLGKSGKAAETSIETVENIGVERWLGGSMRPANPIPMWERSRYRGWTESDIAYDLAKKVYQAIVVKSSAETSQWMRKNEGELLGILTHQIKEVRKKAASWITESTLATFNELPDDNRLKAIRAEDKRTRKRKYSRAEIELLGALIDPRHYWTEYALNEKQTTTPWYIQPALGNIPGWTITLWDEKYVTLTDCQAVKDLTEAKQQALFNLLYRGTVQVITESIGGKHKAALYLPQFPDVIDRLPKTAKVPTETISDKTFTIFQLYELVKNNPGKKVENYAESLGVYDEWGLEIIFKALEDQGFLVADGPYWATVKRPAYNQWFADTRKPNPFDVDSFIWGVYGAIERKASPRTKSYLQENEYELKSVLRQILTPHLDTIKARDKEIPVRPVKTIRGVDFFTEPPPNSLNVGEGNVGLWAGKLAQISKTGPPEWKLRGGEWELIGVPTSQGMARVDFNPRYCAFQYMVTLLIDRHTKAPFTLDDHPSWLGGLVEVDSQGLVTITTVQGRRDINIAAIREFNVWIHEPHYKNVRGRQLQELVSWLDWAGYKNLTKEKDPDTLKYWTARKAAEYYGKAFSLTKNENKLSFVSPNPWVLMAPKKTKKKSKSDLPTIYYVAVYWLNSTWRIELGTYRKFAGEKLAGVYQLDLPRDASVNELEAAIRAHSPDYFERARADNSKVRFYWNARMTSKLWP